MSWLSFWLERYPLMRWLSVRGQEREQGEEEKQTKRQTEKWEQTAEKESDGDDDQWNAGPPSASAASLRSDTLYFLMKREKDKKKNFSSAKITQMWWRRTRERMTRARLRSFTCSFSTASFTAWKKPSNQTSLGVGSWTPSQPCWVDSCHCEAQQVLRELRPPRGTPAQTTWLFSHTPTEAIWSGKVSGAENEKREIDFPFSLWTDCTFMSLGPDELAGPNWSVIRTQWECGAMLLLSMSNVQ